MRAPVYRSIDGDNTFLGLAFPFEVLVVLVVFWATAVLLPPWTGLGVTVAAYAALRLSTMGRPPQHLMHLLSFHRRRAKHAGRFGPAARSAARVAFPFAGHPESRSHS
jgi:hypothetical protein